MRRVILLFILALALWPYHSFAQSRQISGTVTDDKGAPLALVSVVQKGTKTGTTTTENGTFTLTVTGASPVLQFSYSGYQAQDLNIGTSDTYTVALTASGALSEV